MEKDEIATLGRLKARHSTLLSPLVARYAGRIVKLMGDGVLVEFGSVVNAVHCALEIQQEMAKVNAAEPDFSPILLRIGINVGDVFVDGSDLYGDGVNVAARLESIAEPGAIYVSRKVQEELSGRPRSTTPIWAKCLSRTSPRRFGSIGSAKPSFGGRWRLAFHSNLLDFRRLPCCPSSR
jgi:class 3 adenylate cyclase